MCGINGIYAWGRAAPPPDLDELRRTRDQMRLRGPDGSGEWVSPDQRLALAHRRLAIIDLSPAGAQPMLSADGRLAITFNGEIYNYPQLRAELESQGVVFRSHSDTEVLLHLYRRYGDAMVRRLRGMFAFALWDGDGRRLFLARDPYGIKPLYYANSGGVFRFASQVKALRAGGSVSTELDPAGVCGYLMWGSVPEPRTMYQAVRLLEAGCTIVVDEAGASAPARYWNLADVIVRARESAHALPAGHERDELRAALLDSVRAHLVADVPVGAFLSAGLDSSTVVGLATEVSGGAVQTVTLTCEDFKGTPTDELPMAREIAAHFGAHHVGVSVETADMEADLPNFLDAMDQPTIDGVNTWFVSKAAAQAGLKVILSGVGGDELLGGYASFREIPARMAAAAPWVRVPGLPLLHSTLCRLLSPVVPSFTGRTAARLMFGGSYEGAYRLQRGLFMPWELDTVLDADFASAGRQALADDMAPAGSATASLQGFARIVELESTRYMRNQLLRDTDWAGMAHSLEIRTPLVDATFTERVVGWSVSGRLGGDKAILPRTLATALPQAVLQRPKTGFTVPIWKWLRHSDAMDAWKRIPPLRNRRVHDYNRWAYSILAHFPETAGVLRWK